MEVSYYLAFPTLLRIRADPNILITLLDPKCRPACKNRGLAREFALQPVRMLLGQRVRRLACIGGDAFCSRDIYKSMIPGVVGGARQFANSSEFFSRIHEALV